jgi:hypothetical protein
MMKLSGCRGCRGGLFIGADVGESDGEHLERLSPGLVLFSRT